MKNEKYDNYMIRLFIMPNSTRIRLRLFNIYKTNKYSCIKNYLNNRFEDSESINETIFRILYKVEIRPICPICGKPNKYIGKPGSKGLFTKTCCQKCSTKYTNNFKYVNNESYEKKRQTKKKKYEDKNYINDNYILDYFYGKSHKRLNKIKLIDIPIEIKEYLNNRFVDSFSIEETLQRIKLHIYEHPKCICGKYVKYVGGTRMFLNSCGNKECSKIINQNHLKETCKIKYGETNPAKVKEVKEKQKNTNIEKYGYNCVLQNEDIKIKTKHTNIERYGCEISQQNEIIKNKISQSNINTCKEKYGVNNVMQLSYNIDKMFTSKKINNTLNTSNDKDKCYEILKEKFNSVVRQYKSDEYPFMWDFFIPEYKLYIEYNGSWTHGGHPFDENNIDDIDLLYNWQVKAKNSDYYKNAIITWTERDIKKREIAEKNNINFVELWNIDELKFLLLTIEKNDNLLNSEYIFFKQTKGKLSNITNHNNIVKYFQQDTFYNKEKQLWLSNKNIRYKLINNRLYYLNKTELTNFDILNGFKRSSIYYGYSHFNPLLFKWFIEKYKIEKCYDPCGGWGHRLLGSTNLKLYIYNDLSKSTYKNVNRIIEYFNITNAITYNNDASNFMPNEEFDAMFTCPPYYNLEHYECGDFKDKDEFNNFIENLFNVFNNSNAKIFGLVIREDLLNKKYKYTEKYDITPHKSNHLIKEKKHKEYLYIFIKQQ